MANFSIYADFSPDHLDVIANMHTLFDLYLSAQMGKRSNINLVCNFGVFDNGKKDDAVIANFRVLNYRIWPDFATFTDLYLTQNSRVWINHRALPNFRLLVNVRSLRI